MESKRHAFIHELPNFEAAPTRALWKEVHVAGNHGPLFRSSPHKGIMEREGSVYMLTQNEFRSSPHKGIMERRQRVQRVSTYYFEAAPTRALWKAAEACGQNPACYFEAAPTRALWKAEEAAVFSLRVISKQPPQGHYGKYTSCSTIIPSSFRSSPHKGIMERLTQRQASWHAYFEAAPTRALWKGCCLLRRLSTWISKQPPQGHYGKTSTTSRHALHPFRSSPHKGIMERACASAR